MGDLNLDKYINTKGLCCRICGQPLDTKTTITMLCSTCKGKEWSRKQREAFKIKYGVDNPMKLQSAVDKIRNTMEERYGTYCAMNVPEFREKFESTCKKKYGTSYYVNSPEYTSNMSCKSKVNQKFEDLLKANNIFAQTEQECDDKRFDFKLEDIRTYIEIDPTYTHNTAGNHWARSGQPVNQQLIKTLIAEKHDYRCIHVFDWDDWNDIVDLIRPRTKVPARKCQVRVIQDTSYNDFIDKNHIQKQCKGTKVAIGLYFKDELVQVMTFGSPRYNKNYKWELLRLCSKKSLNVVGGPSKLLHYAVSELGLTSIISYCDRSKFTGQVYYKMGMTLLRESSPQEIWSKGSEKITGSLLRQRGYDQLFNANYGKGTSNEQLMLEHGWLPVYDCGQLVFTYGEPISMQNQNSDESSNSTHYSDILKSIDKSKERTCKFCNLPFVPVSNYQQYCKRPHYMACPVCGKQYLVTNNENLKRPPVACSYECRRVRREQTSLEKYGIKTPGNNPEARAKSKATMLEKYGVEHAFESEEIRNRAKSTLFEKYGVDNIQKVKKVADKSHITRNSNWVDKVHELLPIKASNTTPAKHKIDESKMQVYLLYEKASIEFLKEYGFRPDHKFGRIRMSVGLVEDRTIYQVIRFEREANTGRIVLSDFGTKADYYNPNGYSKLIQFATHVKGIDAFDAEVPRGIASQDLISSLNLRKVTDGDYIVYWVTENGLKELTQQDNIEEMLKKYSYVTTDYLDKYTYESQPVSRLDEISEIFISSGKQIN